MGYDEALKSAWDGIASPPERRAKIAFLSAEYTVDFDKRRVELQGAKAPAKTPFAIIILHYLARRLENKGPFRTSGEWVDFNQLEGAQGYFPTFKNRTIEHIVKKYGQRPEALFDAAARLNYKKADKGDVGVIAYPFEDVPVMITLWKADSEFGPEANILFDRSISKIFCVEDIVVLTEILAHSL